MSAVARCWCMRCRLLLLDRNPLVRGGVPYKGPDRPDATVAQSPTESHCPSCKSADALTDPTSLGPWRSSPFWPVEDAEAWVRYAAKTLGPGFHPDTPASGYENGFTEEPSEEARHRAEAAFELGRLRAFHALGDRIYAIGLDEFRNHGWAPPEPG